MTLSRLTYWRLSTLLPVGFPAIAIPVWTLIQGLGVPVPEPIGEGLVVASMGALLFLPVYAILVAVILWLARAQSWQWHAGADSIAPLLMAGAVGVAGPIVFTGTTFSESIRLVAAACLGLGYFYVVLAFAGMWLVARLDGFSNAA